MSKNSLPSLRLQRYSVTFSCRRLIVLTFTFRSLNHFELIFVYVVYPAFLLPFVEKTVLSPLNSLNTLFKNQSTLCVKIYLWAPYSIPLVYMSMFMPVHCFAYSNFVICFELGNSESSKFVLFQDCFDYSGSLDNAYEF